MTQDLHTLYDFETMLENAILCKTQVAYCDQSERQKAFLQLAQLLHELAKTSKPEAAPTIEEVTEGRTVTVYPCPKCGETDPEAESKTPPHRWLDKLRDAEDRANKFQASYNHLNKAWNYNINKWSKIIDSRYCYDEPEVILDIDRALEQGVKDAARVKELEAEVQRLRHIAEGPWTRSQLVAEVDRLNTALQTARADSETLNKLGHALGCCYCTDQGCYTAEPEALMERAKVLCQIEQNDWDKHAAVVEARADAAREERERIVKMAEANRFTVRCWNSTHPMSVRELREALEPKP